MRRILVAAVVLGITGMITKTLGDGEANCDITQLIRDVKDDFAHFVGCDANDVTASLEGGHFHMSDGSATCEVLFKYPSDEVHEDEWLECTQTVSCPKYGQCQMTDPDLCPN